jgi:uncharacterized protein YjaZ
MTVRISFFDQEKCLSDIQRCLFAEKANASIEAIRERTTLENTDILLLVTDNYSQGKFSFTGHTISTHTVLFFVDPEIETLDSDVDQYFSALLAHELHHCLRWPYFKKTIGEAIVLEGMAMSAETTLGFDKRELGEAPLSSDMDAKFAKAYEQIDEPHDGSWIYQVPEVEGRTWSWIYHLGQHVVGKAFENENWDAFSHIHKSAHEIFSAAKGVAN